MDKRKVLESKVPYIELFGVDGMGKGRPANDTPAADLIPRLELPLIGDAAMAMQIRSQARTRAMTVLKTVFSKEFISIYNKEVRHLVRLHESETKGGVPASSDSGTVGGAVVPEAGSAGDIDPVAAGMVAERKSTVDS